MLIARSARCATSTQAVHGEQIGRYKSCWQGGEPVAVIQAEAALFLGDERKLGQKCLACYIDMPCHEITAIPGISDHPVHHRCGVAQRLIPEPTGALVNDVFEVNTNICIQ